MTTKTFKETYWNVERNGGATVICGFSSSARAHEMAKAKGFRTQGTVIRRETTRTWVHSDNSTLSTEYTVRIVESEPSE